LIELKLNNQTALYISVLTIFQACLEKKVYIPRFCYHQSLKIAGNCRMCLVEEKSSIKPIVSCAISIAQGMSIYTQTELVKKAREGVIEYLLINHPLDCPICDQGGECDLQDQTVVFGADRGRFYENKRATQNKNFGFLVKSFLNRCIHCARCTRYINDLAGLDLGIIGRGFGSEVSTYINKFLKSEVSGNVIDLCPVGALTSKPYAFKARPWELVSVYTFDVVEPFASNIEINYRGLEVMRILPRINNEVNDEWISDKTRFYYDSFKVQRLVSPYLKRNGKIKNFS
jgi:NADH-quinone oxidoreductase subunit G